jgi:hypothetical protein
MAQSGRKGMTDAQRTELWHHWRKGEQIARFYTLDIESAFFFRASILMNRFTLSLTACNRLSRPNPERLIVARISCTTNNNNEYSE